MFNNKSFLKTYHGTYMIDTWWAELHLQYFSSFPNDGTMLPTVCIVFFNNVCIAFNIMLTFSTKTQRMYTTCRQASVKVMRCHNRFTRSVCSLLPTMLHAWLHVLHSMPCVPHRTAISRPNFWVQTVCLLCTDMQNVEWLKLSSLIACFSRVSLHMHRRLLKEKCLGLNF